MALDRSKVLETAQKHLAKGNYDRAIAEYHKLVQEDPNDVRTWLKVGDLYTRKGARREACQTYSRVAQHYASQGFFLKAVAVFKQILKLDPTQIDISLRLAEMYEQLQLVSDALNTYEHVAAAYARAGQIDKALRTLGRMTELDPENVPIRIKHAEALSKAAKIKEAATEFEEGARLLKQQGRMDDYIKVAERLLFHRPDDPAVARELAALYLDRQDAKRALSKLQICFKADPKNLETLNMLARAFHILGQLPKSISVYREMARIAHDAGNKPERIRLLQRILELDPTDADAKQALSSYQDTKNRALSASPAAIQAPPPSAIVGGSEAQEEEVEFLEEEAELIDSEEALLLASDEAELVDDSDDVVMIVGEDEESDRAVEPDVVVAPDLSSARMSVPPDVAQEAEIARLLTECDVFLRYGLRDKVALQLEQVLQINPNHVEARERLKDIYIELGHAAEAAQQLLFLASQFEQNKPQVAQLYLRQVLEVDPYNDAAREKLGLPTRSSAAQARNQEPAVTENDGHTAMQAVPADPMEHSIEVVIDEPAAEVGWSSTGTEPGLEPMSPQEFDASPTTEELSRAEAHAQAQERAQKPPGEVEEILDEADFFMAQGLWSEARGTVQEALAAHPSHPVLLDKLQEIAEASGQPLLDVPGMDPDVTNDQSFELAEKLAEELADEPSTSTEGAEQIDVETVFAQFKRGIEETVGLEDSDTHFDLGIAYKEMGLLDDAMHEFELCLQNPARHCIAETMIGMVHMEKGNVEEAITHFKKGLYAEQKSEREELGLYYELGQAYEKLNDAQEALYFFEKVQRRDPTFRNVEERMRRLRDPGMDEDPDAPQVSIDDVDRAFDDLLRDD